MIALAVALFAIQAGFHGFTASLPLALSRGGVPDPEIGLIVGTAALVQVPAAVLGGALVDRFGGVRMLVAGAVAYLAGAAILLVPGVEAGGDRLPFVLARLFQGTGIAATLPAALSLVPRLVAAHRQGFALAFIGTAHNLTLVALPPLSLAILARSSLDGVTVAVIGIVVAGLVVLIAARVPGAVRRGPPKPRPGAAESAVAPPPAPARRRFGLAVRREWIRPLLIVLLYVSHWGVITAYLPQRAEAAGADIGLFFVADGLALLALRIPSGWMADRFPPRWVLLAGLAITAVSIGLLLLAPSTPVLIAAGVLTGGGAGLAMTPILLELSRRSTEADRGSAFSLFSGALAAALVLGSIGVAPLVAAAGFEAAITASIAGLGLAAVVALGDRGLRTARGGVPAPAA